MRSATCAASGDVNSLFVSTLAKSFTKGSSTFTVVRPFRSLLGKWS